MEERDKEKAAHIEAALAKLKNPSQNANLPGTVIVVGQNQTSNRSTIAPAALIDDAGEGANQGIGVAQISQPADIYEAALRRTDASSSASRAEHRAKASVATIKGPLSADELNKFKKIIEDRVQRTVKPAKEQTPVQSITPTDPAKDSAIVIAAAEKEKERQATLALEAEKQLNVEPAQFHQATLNVKKLYRLTALWLSAIPLAMILYLLTSQLRGIFGALTSLVEYVLGLYGLLGWVPLVLLYLKTRKS